jgi:hypothetical protein
VKGGYNMENQYEYKVTQELKSQTKLWSTVSIYASDLVFILSILFLAYLFQGAVAAFLLPIYWISSVLLSVLLITRSKLNPKRRLYETMMLYTKRDLNIYRSVYSQKNTVSKREKENMKNKTEKTDKYTSDILPKSYDKEYECFVKENGCFNLVEIITKDIVNASMDEVEYDIAKLEKFNKLEYKPYKIISLNFPCNTMEQQNYLNYKIEKCKNSHFRKCLETNLQELQWVQDKKSKREFYLMYFADSFEELKKMDMDMKAALNIGEEMIRDMSQEKKEKVLYRLNNMASVLSGGQDYVV